MTTFWRCEHCSTSGSIRHSKRAFVEDVRLLLVTSHANASEACSYQHGLSGVRVSLQRDALLGAKRKA
jgi:hypothetical protein